MSRHSRFVFLGSLLLVVLLVSLVSPMGVSAQEEIPPPTATQEPVQPPPTEEPATEEVAATEAPVMTEEAEDPEDPAVDQTMTTEVPAMTEAPVVATQAPVAAEIDVEPAVENEASETAGESPAAEALTVAKVLETAPEGTEVVLLNAKGSPEPLASVEAVEIFQTGDPYYTVAGITYYFMPIGGCGALANCTESATPIQTAIDYLNGTAALSPWFGTGATPTDGTIYVGAGTYTGNITLDGNAGWNAGANKPAALTLSGAGSSSTILDGSLSITNMNVFTLSGFTVIDADNSGNSSRVIASDNTGAITLADLNVTNSSTHLALEGILIEHHTGDIILTHVTSNNNNGIGALLDNCSRLIGAGGTCTGSGNVNIIDSTFNDNSGGGLSIHSSGEVTLASVTASGNGAHGLSVSSDADITLMDVIANRNRFEGASLRGHNVSITDSSFNENRDGFWGYSLDVFSTGDITLSGVTADNNGSQGAFLFTGSGNISVSDSTFDGNGYTGGLVLPGSTLYTGGLQVSSPAEVTLVSVTANGNRGYGLSVFAQNGMTLTGVTANDNGEYGLELFSPNDITLMDVAVNGNNWDGVLLNGGVPYSGNVTILCSQFKNNGGFGIDASDLEGSLTLNDVSFTGNANGDYAYLGTPVITSGACSAVVESESKSEGDESAPGLPLHSIDVNSGEQIDLDCSSYSGTQLVLPNGDRVIFPCPLRDQAHLTGLTQVQLPADPGSTFGFVSALEAGVTRDGASLAAVPANLTIEFLIPEGQQGAELAILRWDAAGSQWVEVPGGRNAGDGHFVATSNFTGIFVLVSK